MTTTRHTKIQPELIKAGVSAARHHVAQLSLLKWQLGDLLLWLRDESPTDYKRVCLALDDNPRDLLIWVAKRSTFRHPFLSWEHHLEVGNLTDAAKRSWLNEAHSKHLTPAQLRKAIRASCKTIHRKPTVRVKVKPEAIQAVKQDREHRQGKGGAALVLEDYLGHDGR